MANRQITVKCWILAAGAALILASGCTRTVVGGYIQSPDKKYCVYGRIYGAYGRAFIDETSKKVRVSIVTGGTNETLLFRKKYPVRGSDVNWDATWDTHNNLTVVVYDYGRGVTRWDAKKQGSLPTNHLFTLRYRLDPKTGSFIESPPKS